MRPQLVQSAKRSAAAFVEMLLPGGCPLCGGELPPDCVDDLNCSECATRIPRADRYCVRCSAPVGPFVDSSNGCVHCRRDRFVFEGVFAAGKYRDALQQAVLMAKRPRGGAAAAWLAQRIWERRGPELSQLPIDLVTAVPQHWLRRLAGPHNAAELIARPIAGRLKAPFDRHILHKARRTAAQAGLPPSARRKNLRTAFLATRSLQGSRILLIDDVLTTGTTSDQAARALRRAGASAVWVVVAARGIGV